VVAATSGHRDGDVKCRKRFFVLVPKSRLMIVGISGMFWLMLEREKDYGNLKVLAHLRGAVKNWEYVRLEKVLSLLA
jgi:hypothetical protein